MVMKRGTAVVISGSTLLDSFDMISIGAVFSLSPYVLVNVFMLLLNDNISLIYIVKIL
jgi:hypothetical protein